MLTQSPFQNLVIAPAYIQSYSPFFVLKTIYIIIILATILI